MADIRSYLKEKEKRGTQEVTFQDRIYKHRLTFFYRILLIVLVLGALITLVVVQYQRYVYEGYDILTTAEKKEISGITETALGNVLLTYSKDGAHCTDAQGTVLWNQTYEMQSPIMATCGNVAAFADYTGRTIYVYDTSKKLGTIDTTMPLRDLCVAANGVTAAILDDSDVTWLKVFDTEGNSLVEFRISMKESGYPLSVNLSPNGLLCAISYMYVDTGELKSKVAFFNFGEVGKNQPDNFVCGYDYGDTVIPFVKFMDNENSFAVGDDRLLFFQGSQKPENAHNVLFSEELKAVYHNEQYVGLVFPDTTGGGNRLDIYDNSGNKLQSHEFDMDYTDILFDNNNFIIYNETEMYIGTVGGAEKYNGSLDKPASVLIPTGKAYRYIMVTGNSIDTIRLK